MSGGFGAVGLDAEDGAGGGVDLRVLRLAVVSTRLTSWVTLPFSSPRSVLLTVAGEPGKRSRIGMVGRDLGLRRPGLPTRPVRSTRVARWALVASPSGRTRRSPARHRHTRQAGLLGRRYQRFFRMCAPFPSELRLRCGIDPRTTPGVRGPCMKWR